MNVNALIDNIQQSQRTMLVIVATLGLLASIMFGFSLYQWTSDWILAHQSSTEIPSLGTNETATLIASIPDAHLFGQSLNGDEAPISSLQMHVTGIVKAENADGENVSKAYISISGQPSKIYQIGDDLPYGVKIYDITADYVILQNDGKLEKLPLAREKLQFKPVEPVDLEPRS